MPVAGALQLHHLHDLPGLHRPSGASTLCRADEERHSVIHRQGATDEGR